MLERINNVFVPKWYKQDQLEVLNAVLVDQNKKTLFC